MGLYGGVGVVVWCVMHSIISKSKAGTMDWSDVHEIDYSRPQSSTQPASSQTWRRECGKVVGNVVDVERKHKKKPWESEVHRKG